MSDDMDDFIRISPEDLAVATPEEQEAYFHYLVESAKQRDEWELWLTTFFPNVTTKPFSQGHKNFFEWVWSIEKGVKPENSWVSIWPRGQAKALALDTPLPTPAGWTTMGAVEVGDQLIDEQGRPCFVTHVSEVHDKPASRVGFKGAGSIVAADDHDWTALDAAARKRMRTQDGGIVDNWYCWKSNGVPRGSSPRPAMARTVTTSDMADRLMYGKAEYQWAIPCSKSWDLPKVDLPIDPYVLGYWLGDGTTTAGTITVGHQDVDETLERLRSRGRIVNLRSHSNGNTLAVEGLHRELRLNGLKGYKHIPEPYLRGSIEQRRDLLAGLMDSDGHSTGRNSAQFTSTLERLARGVHELAVSLGYRASVNENRATLYGKDCGPVWVVGISGSPDGMFELERKKGRLAESPYVMNSKLYLVKSVESIGVVPVKCVTVDSPSHLFLAGSDAVPTHNSSSMEMAIAALAARGKRKYGVVISESLDQAEDHIAAVATLLSSPIVAMAYPNLGDPMVTKTGNSRGWRRNRLATASGFVLDALGLESNARGAKFDDQRPDFLCLDDLDGESDTEATTEKKIRTITHKLIPAGSPDVAVLMVQNLVHSKSVFARLASTNEEGQPERADWLRNRIVDGPIPAIYDMEIAELEGKFVITGGTPSWPEGRTIKDCQDIMNEVGYTAFMSEYQHVTRAADGNVFSHLTFEHCERAELPKLKRTVVWVDPAVTSTESSDSMGIQADALGVDGKIYRLFSWEQRSTPYAAIKKAVLKAIELKADVIGVETNQGGDTWKFVYNQVCEDIRNDIARDGGDFFKKMPRYKEVKASEGTGSKIVRAERMLVDYERNMFVHVKGQDEVLEAALRRFPKVKPYDLVDAAVWSWSELAGPLNRRKIKMHGSSKKKMGTRHWNA